MSLEKAKCNWVAIVAPDEAPETVTMAGETFPLINGTRLMRKMAIIIEQLSMNVVRVIRLLFVVGMFCWIGKREISMWRTFVPFFYFRRFSHRCEESREDILFFFIWIAIGMSLKWKGDRSGWDKKQSVLFRCPLSDHFLLVHRQCVFVSPLINRCFRRRRFINTERERDNDVKERDRIASS